MTSSKEYDKAVALRYKPGMEKAPRVIAVGKGKIAEKIVRIAKEHNIHVHNDPDLVEMLSELEINSEIPPELYVVVSEILVFVYSLNRKEMSG